MNRITIYPALRHLHLEFSTKILIKQIITIKSPQKTHTVLFSIKSAQKTNTVLFTSKFPQKTHTVLFTVAYLL